VRVYYLCSCCNVYRKRIILEVAGWRFVNEELSTFNETYDSLSVRPFD